MMAKENYDEWGITEAHPQHKKEERQEREKVLSGNKRERVITVEER